MGFVMMKPIVKTAISMVVTAVDHVNLQGFVQFVNVSTLLLLIPLTHCLEMVSAMTNQISQAAIMMILNVVDLMLGRQIVLIVNVLKVYICINIARQSICKVKTKVKRVSFIFPKEPPSVP